ncbi:MAG: 16S rRNA (guanine(527)-N(7))-methyltransferase RsmG [Cocleimonas sp.]|nr:16S rRNA (guanine(527)-N(7))-methyltransferase RsmG [Cocleimonas sp.]
MDKLWTLGLEALNCNPNDEQLGKLKQYVTLLHRWNKTYNLTAIRDPLQMIPLHIFDSLAVAPYIEGENCLDVGSGGGLPGIPLAIMQPQRDFTLLDTNGKKTRFMQQVVIELGLKNVNIVQSRVENWQSEHQFDTIISRAFASIIDFVETSSLHLSNKGQLLAMKGQLPESELSLLTNGFIVAFSKTLLIPDVSGERCVIKIISKY